MEQMFNPFERLLLTLQAEMTCPEPWGLFHWISLLLTFGIIAFLYTRKQKHSEEQLKVILGIYGVIALALEVGKQLIWSFNYDAATQVVIWDYEWYAAPFQLCTTPMYVCLACLFMKKCALRDALLSYVAYITILGSIAMMLLPESCFVSDILVNVHTTYLHFGSFVVSVYLLMSGEVSIQRQSLLHAMLTFAGFVMVAALLNEFVYRSGILQGETFNMFYISPYFSSELPIFNSIQPAVSSPVFITLYVVVLGLGGFLIYNIAFLIKCIWQKCTVPGFTMKQAKYFR